LTADSIEKTILELVRMRGPGKTICPSEAARALGGDRDFRRHMQPVRDAAERLARSGQVEVTQKGRPVVISRARGPVRIGLP
jgi:hypothetical protein